MSQMMENPDKELLVRVKTILVLRVVFLTGFVGLIFAFLRNVIYEMPIGPLSVCLGIAYFLSAIFALLLKLKIRLNILSWMQVVGDLLVVGGIIFATGGITSPLSFLYLFVIIETSTLLPRAASYMAASGASIIYGLLVDLEYFQVISPVHLFPHTNFSFHGSYGFYIIALNIASFYSVAFLGSILTHRMRLIKEELTLKSIDLEKLREFHKNVVRNMGNGLITTDLEGNITSVNNASEEITGYESKECLGKCSYELLAISSLRDFFKSGQIYSLPLLIEGKCSRKNGNQILVKMKISQLDENMGQHGGFICVFEDLSEIREMEDKIKQGEQLAAVGKFSAGLAHEVRNPLASLSGSIQVLKKGLKLEGDYKRLMNIVIKETERLNHIVTGFLNFSLPHKVRNTVVDMTQLLQDIITLMKNREEYHAEIKFKLDVAEEPTLIVGDEDDIKQMVWNLCLNGMQAMNNGGTLSLSLKEKKGFIHKDYKNESRGVILQVTDEGCGIPSEKIKSIFDPFVTTKEDGIGLGLSTVHQIAERCGYYIGLDSELDRGTCFTIFIPQVEQLMENKALDTQT
ncbi:MAG: PAS domain S-box protein [Nitrospinae bacterium]|nr:PAS domain S-box protein [Nitrospinota bacterium]